MWLFCNISLMWIYLKLYKSSDFLFLLFVSMLHVFVQKYFNHLTCFPLVSRLEETPHHFLYLFQSPSIARKVTKVSSLLHFGILHSPVVQGLWLSCDSHGLGFCLCRVSVRPYLSAVYPARCYLVCKLFSSSSLVTQVLEQSMSPISQAALVSSLRERAPALPTIQDPNSWCWGTLSVACHDHCCSICINHAD